jgi:hypothetical protein
MQLSDGPFRIVPGGEWRQRDLLTASETGGPVKKLRLASVLALALLAGAATGYYFGYDIGLERAARTLGAMTAPSGELIQSFTSCPG